MTPDPTLRYFVDKFPLFLDSSNGSSSPVVTLSFVDPGHTTLGAFAHHVNLYMPLCQYLANFHFVYIAANTVHFDRAETCFASLIKAPLRQMVPEELEKYFRLREAWERKQYRLLSTEDIEWLDQANQRFGGARVEWLFQLWGSGDSGKQQWRQLLSEAAPPNNAEFRTVLVTNVPVVNKIRRMG